MPPAADSTTTMELAAIVRNAARLGIPAWRVTIALGLSAAQRAEVEAAIEGGPGSSMDG